MNFFGIGTDSSLFNGMEIANDPSLCDQYMGKYPVLSISMKDVDGLDFRTAYDMLCIAVSEEARRFGFLMDSSKLTRFEKEQLARLMQGEFEKAAYLHNSLRLLTELLFRHYGMEEKFGEFKEWYDGYRFGQVDIYCPWDVINQCNKFLETKEAPMEAHWENSSSNVIVQDILTNATETTKGQIEALISGETEEKL